MPSGPDPSLGVWFSTPNHIFAELALNRGFSHFVLDLEHGVFEEDPTDRLVAHLRALGTQIALLAWGAPERLYTIEQEGRVAVSSDGGRKFRPTGEVPGEPVALMAAGSELYVALADNKVMRSADGGATWSVRTQV